jgi:hypothetical protein
MWTDVDDTGAEAASAAAMHSGDDATAMNEKWRIGFVPQRSADGRCIRVRGWLIDTPGNVWHCLALNGHKMAAVLDRVVVEGERRSRARWPAESDSPGRLWIFGRPAAACIWT